MVNAAKAGKPPPTDEQYIMLLCQKFNCLPSQIQDEDGPLLNRMMIYESIYSAVKKRKEATGEKIHELPEGVNKVLDMLDEMGIKYDGLS